MATCNFTQNPAPFPIYAMSGEDLEVWTCQDCDVVLERDGEGWTCPDCGCHTIYPDQDACTRDEWLERMRVEDLADELETAVDDFEPMFYRVELRSGYYGGVQIAVTLEDDPRDMDEDDARGLWGLGRSAPRPRGSAPCSTGGRPASVSRRWPCSRASRAARRGILRSRN